MRIREAESTDMPFLECMLYQAAQGINTSAPDVQDPYYRRYYDALVQRQGETVVAEQDSELTGAVWYRYYDLASPGYGFRGVDIPEVTIAVAPAFRGEGLGLKLMRALVAIAQEGEPKELSLNVEANNGRALALYKRLGYRLVSTELDGSFTMALDTSNS